jgi:hypothetical protein
MLSFYTYISKSKVEMLLPQIPAKLKKKFAAEVGVHVGVFDLKLSSELTDEVRSADSHKVKLLSDYIEATEEVGSLNHPRAWVKDRLKVKNVRIEDKPEIFMLVGLKYEKCHLLGGSARHVVGHSVPGNASVTYSYFPHIAAQLQTTLLSEEIEEWPSIFGEEAEPFAGESPDEWVNAVWMLYESCKTPEFEIEFLGRFLAQDRRIAVGAHHVALLADADVLVALGADRLEPDRILPRT